MKTAYWLDGIKSLRDALQQAHSAGDMPRELLPLLHDAAEALRYNGHAAQAVDLLNVEKSLGVERYITYKLDWARQKTLALFECHTAEGMAEGEEIAAYYALRPYLFPDIKAMGFFLFIHCLVALRRNDPQRLAYPLEMLSKTEAGALDCYLQRVIQQAGGLARLLSLLPSIGMGSKLCMGIAWSGQVLGGYGAPAAIFCRGLHILLAFSSRISRMLASNQRALLPCRGTRSPLPRKRLPILITRAMGGIGDIMMMTPGLRALAKLHPQREIHIALPRAFHSLLENNPYVRVKDIHADPFYREDYAALYNLTECPAARVESASLPRVRANRIEIFAKAMGVKKKKLRKIGTRPVYVVSAEEKAWAENFFREHGLEPGSCLAVQPYAADSYKAYPDMEKLTLKLAASKPVLLFHSAPVDGFEHERILKIVGFSLRQSIALLSLCERLISVDSAFVHVAAAFDLPTTALFGPTDGGVFTRYYPACTLAGGNEKVDCGACWRNQRVVCAKTLRIGSGCLEDIQPDL